jgi:hypothetical protein
LDVSVLEVAKEKLRTLEAKATDVSRKRATAHGRRPPSEARIAARARNSFEHHHYHLTYHPDHLD